MTFLTYLVHYTIKAPPGAFMLIAPIEAFMPVTPAGHMFIIPLLHFVHLTFFHEFLKIFSRNVVLNAEYWIFCLK